MSDSTPTFSRRGFLQAVGGVALAGATGAGLAACGSNTGRSGGAGALQQWYHQYGEQGTQQAALKFAKAYKDATVNVVWTPGDYGAKLASGLLSSSAPDVFESQLNIEYVKAGQVAPLDDIFASVKGDFNEADIKLNTYEGKIYGIKMIDDPQLLYYRKSMLQKAGVQPPTTFDELTAAVKKLSTGKVKGAYFGSQNFIDGSRIQPYFAAMGVPVITEDHKSNVLDPAVIASFVKLREFYTSGGVLQSAPTEWTDPSAFIQELVAIQWTGLWALPQIQKTFGDDFGVIPIPALGPKGKQVVYNGGWTQFVNAKSKNLDAAKKFVKWLWIDQTQYQEEWSLNYGFHIPPRPSVAAKATKLQSGQAAEVVKIAKQFGAGDNIAFTPKIGTALSDAGNKILRSGADPKAALTVADGIVQSELKRLFG